MNVDCGGLTNGRVMVGATVFESVATYTCNNGYNLNGDDTRLCLGKGFWSGSEQACVEGIYIK